MNREGNVKDSEERKKKKLRCQRTQCKCTPEKSKRLDNYSTKPSPIKALDLGPQQPQSVVEPHPGTSSNLNVPIALHKGTRSCVTHHPIQNFVSYNY